MGALALVHKVCLVLLLDVFLHALLVFMALYLSLWLDELDSWHVFVAERVPDLARVGVGVLDLGDNVAILEHLQAGVQVHQTRGQTLLEQGCVVFGYKEI
jgi:hypothetical protein